MPAPTRVGDWMQTYTGRPFWPLDPRVEDIDPIDIAHALSMVCRFGGHVSRFYSVAEHCVLMSYVVDRRHALWTLVHDATKAYIGDLVRPLKYSLPPHYRQVEQRLMAVICDHFGISRTCPPIIKELDVRILRDERAALLKPSPLPWNADECVEPLGVQIECWTPQEARFRYLQRLTELVGARL